MALLQIHDPGAVGTVKDGNGNSRFLYHLGKIQERLDLLPGRGLIRLVSPGKMGEHALCHDPWKSGDLLHHLGLFPAGPQTDPVHPGVHRNVDPGRHPQGHRRFRKPFCPRKIEHCRPDLLLHHAPILALRHRAQHQHRLFYPISSKLQCLLRRGHRIACGVLFNGFHGLDRPMAVAVGLYHADDLRSLRQHAPDRLHILPDPVQIHLHIRSFIHFH